MSLPTLPEFRFLDEPTVKTLFPGFHELTMRFLLGRLVASVEAVGDSHDGAGEATITTEQTEIHVSWRPRVKELPPTA